VPVRYRLFDKTLDCGRDFRYAGVEVAVIQRRTHPETGWSGSQERQRRTGPWICFFENFAEIVLSIAHRFENWTFMVIKGNSNFFHHADAQAIRTDFTILQASSYAAYHEQQKQ